MPFFQLLECENNGDNHHLLFFRWASTVDSFFSLNSFALGLSQSRTLKSIIFVCSVGIFLTGLGLTGSQSAFTVIFLSGSIRVTVTKQTPDAQGTDSKKIMKISDGDIRTHLQTGLVRLSAHSKVARKPTSHSCSTWNQPSLFHSHRLRSKRQDWCSFSEQKFEPEDVNLKKKIASRRIN